MGEDLHEKVFCDIGSGKGYFSLKATRIFKQVYASDVDKKALAKLRTQVKKQGLTNIQVIDGKYEDALLPEGKCDILFMAMVYHHIEDRVAYLKNMKKYLAPNGRFFNLDNVIDTEKYKNSGKRVPGPSCRFAKERFLKESGQAGFHLSKNHNVLNFQYLVELKAL